MTKQSGFILCPKMAAHFLNCCVACHIAIVNVDYWNDDLWIFSISVPESTPLANIFYRMIGDVDNA